MAASSGVYKVGNRLLPSGTPNPSASGPSAGLQAVIDLDHLPHLLLAELEEDGPEAAGEVALTHQVNGLPLTTVLCDGGGALSYLVS